MRTGLAVSLNFIQPMRQAIAAIALSTIALAVAALRAAPIDDLPAPIVTRQAVFSIPFTVPAADTSQQPAEVLLLASGDRGTTWQVTDRVDLRAQRLPYKGGFTFRAPADGEYWFAIRTLDRKGLMPGNKIGGPELRVVVDTRPPRLDMSASQGTAGEIVVRWQVVDPNLKPDSVRLEYQSTGNPRWQPIALDSSSIDNGRSTISNSATWWPADAAGVVTIKAEVSDLAGNTSVSQTKLDLQRAPGAPVDKAGNDRQPLTTNINQSASRDAETTRSNFDSPRPNLEPTFPSGASWSPNARTDLPLGRGLSDSTRPPRSESDSRRDANVPQIAPIEGPALAPSPDGRFRPSGQRPDSSRDAAATAKESADHTARINISRGAEVPVNPPIASRYTPAENSSRQRDAMSPSNSTRSGTEIPPSPNLPQYFERGGTGAVTTRDAPPPRTARVSNFDFVLPPGEHLRMVNSTTFELAYDVDAIGRSGIAKVELWVTRDGGRTWTSMGVDSDNRSPFVTTVDAEGVYGYRMTVQSGSGLGGRPPQPGDLPELWIGVDLTRPTARLISAEAGTGDRAGEIVIRYEANDALLANRPVSLFQSAQPGGPWTTIAAGLDNSGQYSWRFDNSVPDRVYLRLEVRDEGGNVGTFEAADPISLERVLPQGRLRSVRPVGESAGSGATAVQSLR